jgi:hypothetical protein
MLEEECFQIMEGGFAVPESEARVQHLTQTSPGAEGAEVRREDGAQHTEEQDEERACFQR